MTKEEIAATAEHLRGLGVPDHLNRWLTMTPESLASNEARRRTLTRGEFAMKAERKQAPPPGEAQPQESVLSKRAKPKAAAPKSAKRTDRSPRAVGDFIVAGGAGGVEMAAIEKKFGMDAHPLRSKIHAARHDLGYQIEYVSTTKRYVGKAPPESAAA